MVVLVLASCLTTVATAAQRTFVSVKGSDANSCSVTLPCRTFGAAISQTAVGGEVVVLDSGGYGPAAINQAVSITAPAGIFAGITVTIGTGLAVNAGSGIVALTGLTINGLGGAIGIDYQSGDTLRLKNVVISGLLSAGLSGTLSGSSNVDIQDSDFFDDGNFGIYLRTSSGTLGVSIERIRIDGNNIGLNLSDNVVGVVADAIITNNFSGGFVQAITAGATTKVTIQRCTISRGINGLYFGNVLAGTTTTIEVVDSEFSDNSATAIFTESFGTAYFTNTKITRNAVGIDTATYGGSAISFGDNVVIANGAGQAFSSTALKK